MGALKCRDARKGVHRAFMEAAKEYGVYGKMQVGRLSALSAGKGAQEIRVRLSLGELLQEKLHAFGD